MEHFEAKRARGAPAPAARPPRLGEEQEVVLGAAPDDEGGDDPRLRRQEECLARAPTGSASTSFDTIRFRYAAASGPFTET